MTCKCGHDQWEHHVEEIVYEDGDESFYFEDCTKCDCQQFEPDMTEQPVGKE